MELSELDIGLQYAAAQGRTLNVHEKLQLKIAMNKIKVIENTYQVYFWGKFTAKSNNYYIAYVLTDDQQAFPTKKFFWCDDKFEFALLPVLSNYDLQFIESLYEELYTPLYGIPLRKLGEKEYDEAAEEEEARKAQEEVAAEDAESPSNKEKKEEKKIYREINRVAYLVHQINLDTSVVPKNSYTIDANHLVRRSKIFDGLRHEEALCLSSWSHFRPAEDLKLVRACNEESGEDKSFLMRLNEDIPRESWNLKLDYNTNVATVRSLMWPGYIAYHILRTPSFGSIYIGNGNQMRELPFLL